MAATPKTSKILEILLPNILPMAKSDAPCRAANTLTTNSAAEVPKATTVSPMTIGEIFNFLAREAEPLIKNSPPTNSTSSPAIRKMIGKIIL